MKILSASIKPRQLAYIQNFAKEHQVTVSEALRRLLELAGAK